ncbi:MAG: isocitrate/isopropylmalate dehydrogenase family protein, partial [Synergistales bacterium]|nr:isocitrate/isopropylmalate dehydrogenase family protein [Synergistales bacterium]
ASHYLETGEILPEWALQEIEKGDALLLGAIGDPRVKPGILERGILLTLRFHFDMFANLRPARQFPRVPVPVKVPDGEKMDLLVVRENTEDLYMGLGKTSREDIDYDIHLTRGLYELSGKLEIKLEPSIPSAVQIGIASEEGVRRITARACEEAVERGQGSFTLASKSNAMPQLYGFWEEIASDEARKHGMEIQMANVDALCYHLVRNPWKYNVILCPNLFGDIVSDLLAGLTGGLGVAAGANIGSRLGMFEPIHGSAPDIAGTGRANPMAAIFSSSLMLSSLGERGAADAIVRSLSSYLLETEDDSLPVEFGGRALTDEVGEAIRLLI